MPTYRISLGRPETTPPVYDFAQTVVASDQQIAIGQAYQTWSNEASYPVPALSMCHVSVRDINQLPYAMLNAAAVTTGQQEFADALEKQVGTFLGTKLNGTFSTVAYPSGFNYGITYGSNAYYNAATLQDFDTLLGTSSSGQLELTGGSYATLYDQILAAVVFNFSTADQSMMNKQDTAASAQIASILTEFQNAGGVYSNPLPFGGKLQDVINQMNKMYGDISKIPSTLNALRNAIAAYQAIAGASYTLHNQYYEATARLAAARDAVKTPSAANGGEQTDTDKWFVGYTPNKLPTANELISGLQTDSNSVNVQLTLSNFSSTSTELKVAGSAGISIPILDVLSIHLGASGSYDLSTFTSSSSTVTMDLTYKGVTIVAATPSDLSADNSTGWYDNLILQQIIANDGKDATGYQLVGHGFNVADLFGPGKAFSRLKTFVISQAPEMVMTFEGSDTSTVKSDLKVGATMSVDLFGLFRLGSASASYQVQKVVTNSSTGAVTVTFGAPVPSGTIPLEQQKAYVLGGVASYPPNNI